MHSQYLKPCLLKIGQFAVFKRHVIHIYPMSKCSRSNWNRYIEEGFCIRIMCFDINCLFPNITYLVLMSWHLKEMHQVITILGGSDITFHKTTTCRRMLTDCRVLRQPVWYSDTIYIVCQKPQSLSIFPIMIAVSALDWYTDSVSSISELVFTLLSIQYLFWYVFRSKYFKGALNLCLLQWRVQNLIKYFCHILALLRRRKILTTHENWRNFWLKMTRKNYFISICPIKQFIFCNLWSSHTIFVACMKVSEWFGSQKCGVLVHNINAQKSHS